MKKLTFLIPFLVSLALVLLTRGAQAQFETPNRSFHNATTFRLEGKHLTLACEACHLNNQYSGTPKTCYECHWVRRKDDRYQTRLGSQCEQCHRPTSWTAVRWDHAGQAGVPLNGAHRQVACESCHRGAVFTGVSVSCVDCHQKDFAATTTPNHLAAGFPTACEGCHRPSDSTWRNGGGDGFNHNAVFSLVGAHSTAACVSCHRGNVYKGTSRECVGCHLAQYNATRAPAHAAAGFPTTCESCHRSTDTSWGGAGGFNHGAIFALVGVHATQSCTSCHGGGVYRGTPRECVGCHLPKYNATTRPSHAAAGFSTACESCHRASDPSWTGAAFNHNSVFALVGRHAGASCESCHRNNVYKGTSRSCVGCHQAQYNATRNPNHASSGFGTNCESCHRAGDSSWQQGTFNHRFPLRGEHNVSCARCHTSGNYQTFSCTVCHTRGETDDEHRGRSGYVYESRACYSCHPNGKGD